MKKIDISLFSKDVQSLIRQVGAEADAAGLRAFCVGGAVRDVLLGRESSDVDVVVEGDGIAFAGKLSKRFAVSAVFHEKFGTAALALKSGMVLDVVSARKEVYAHGGALPDVVPAKLKDDLLRRDFTVNAIAMSINGVDLGSLRDDAGGLDDIESKLIRIIHEDSFIDDPTRILRAARYAVRFGFQFEALTQDAMDQAVAADVLKAITPVRYFLELRRILDEKDPAPALDLLSSVGAICYVPYEGADRQRLLASPEGWMARLGALLQEVPVSEAHAIMALFNISRSAQKKILNASS